uniref:Uncharacterized protein n=1 Tax=Arundo donax TaxID=35708 RepID=A0A0A8ZK02_ARUDO
MMWSKEFTTPFTSPIVPA